MKNITLALGMLAVLSCLAVVTMAQENYEKEYIIIEKTVDENGNEVSKKITRKKGQQIDDQELEELLESDNPFGQFDIQSLGFGPEMLESWSDWLEPRITDEKPTIGLSLSFENSRVKIVAVNRGSGADESDIRAGDELISIDGIAISTFDDIQNILSDKKSGDELRLRIVRDGQELEKVVKLKGAGRFPYDLDIWGSGPDGFFNNEAFDFDSLLDRLRESGWDSISYDMDPLLIDPEIFDTKPFNKTNKSNSASLGVFIDDRDGHVAITEIVADSAADQAGLLEGDIITRFDDQVITSYQELVMLMGQFKAGDVVNLTIDRGDGPRKISVTLQARQ